MKQTAWLSALVLSLAACNGAPPSTTTNSMTSAGATEPTADNIAAPVTDATAATPTATLSASPAVAAAGDTAGDNAEKWAGRWIGVEGTYLSVTPTGANTATLEMQYDLDNKGTYPATVTPEGLRFTRDGEQMMLRPSDGDATGLKWLAGKKNCLTVKSGEGYCRA